VTAASLSRTATGGAAPEGSQVARPAPEGSPVARPAPEGSPVAGPAPVALFEGLLDDAAIFPPGNAAMPDALRAYAESRKSPHARFIGSFVCSSDRLDELLAALPPESAPLDLALVVRGGAAELSAALSTVEGAPELALRAVEIPAGEDGAARTAAALDALPAGVSGYVEVPLNDELPIAVRAIAESGLRVKLRTGGTTASAFPGEDALAVALGACLRVGVAFKLTAGLHSAVRHRDPATGFEHHGFLNVLAAVGQATDGTAAAGTDAALAPGSVAEQLRAVLAERDPAVLATAVAALSEDQARQVRSRFVSFGTCSTAEPIEDLLALGLVAPEAG